MNVLGVRVPGELVTFINSDGLPLDGLLYTRPGNTVTIVHVHGSMGNFYHNLFLRVMALRYLNAGINLLTFNLSAHDCLSEGFRFDYTYKYTGGAIVPFETCLGDIRAAVAFAHSITDTVVLQGHSLGCDRVLHYVTEDDSACDVILLGACDSYKLQSFWIAPETVEEQLARLKRGAHGCTEWQWLPVREYGVRSGDEEYIIPITLAAFLSIAEGPPFRLIRYDRGPTFRLSQRVFIYIGGRDAFLTVSPETVFEYFESTGADVTRVLFPDSDHDMDGCEEAVISAIIHWVKRQGIGGGDG